jgi:hypothetical protein
MIGQLEVIQTQLDYNVYDLFCGNKNLTVVLPQPEFIGIVTGIQKTNNSATAGSTTAIYSRANELMQKVINEMGCPAEYVYKTNSMNMVQWGRKHGGRIFDWAVAQDNDYGFLAKKLFTPSI